MIETSKFMKVVLVVTSRMSKSPFAAVTLINLVLSRSVPPLPLGGPQQNPPAAFITKPAYNFTIDGVERKA